MPMPTSIRWRRMLLFAIAAAAAIAAFASLPIGLDAYDAYREREAAEPKPIPASDAQQVAIVRALLLAHDYEAPHMPPTEADEALAPEPEDWPLLVDRTIRLRPPCTAAASGSAPCSPNIVANDDMAQIDILVYEFRHVTLKLRRELLLANARSSAMPLPGIDGVRLVSSTRGFTPIVDAAFFQANPGAAGIVHVSRAVLTEDGTQALIYAVHHCGKWCESSSLFVLERRAGEWMLARELLVSAT
jgi:hypothetical protein